MQPIVVPQRDAQKLTFLFSDCLFGIKGLRRHLGLDGAGAAELRQRLDDSGAFLGAGILAWAGRLIGSDEPVESPAG